MPVMDMWAWIKDTIEPLKREIEDLREEVEELKHELAELKVQQVHASAQVPAQAEEQLQEKERIVKWQRRGWHHLLNLKVYLGIIVLILIVIIKTEIPHYTYKLGAAKY